MEITNARLILPDSIEKRPFYLTKDGKGKPVLDLFA